MRFTKMRSLTWSVFSIEPDGMRKALKKKVRMTNDTTMAIARIMRISLMPLKKPPERFLRLLPACSAVIVLFPPVHKSYPSESYPHPAHRGVPANRSNRTGYPPARTHDPQVLLL